MGCNCGKKGSRTTKTPESTKSSAQASGAPAKGTTQSFALQHGATTVATFGSRLEAEAERVRRGGMGTVVAT